MNNRADLSDYEAIAKRLDISLAAAILFCKDVSRCFDKGVPVHAIRFRIFQMSDESPTVDEVASCLSRSDSSLMRVASHKDIRPRERPSSAPTAVVVNASLVRKVARLLPSAEADRVDDAQEFLRQVAKLYPSLLRRENALLAAVEHLVSENKLSVYRTWKLATKYKVPRVVIISTPMGGKTK
jgi:hypothetical protein